MAQKAIREIYGKNLLFAYLPKYLPQFKQTYLGKLITASDLKLPEFSQGYVVKPDELFGKRGKNGLIFITQKQSEAVAWIKARMGKSVKVIRNPNDKGIEGILNNFLVEPFVKHDQEYYVAIKSSRLENIIYFSNRGGIDVEENWKDVTELRLPFSLEPKALPEEIKSKLEKVIKADSEANKKLVVDFFSALNQVFIYLDFAYLEINPFTVVNARLEILDLVARLDDMAEYNKSRLWQAGENALTGSKLEFPPQFGSARNEAEQKIIAMDAKTGASLKFTVLNPNGRIWLLTSGGGGSVIMSDTAGDLGFSQDLANFGEYSGNPSTDETAEYTKIVLGEMLKSNAKNKIVFVGGGIANFTDIKATFSGIVEAIKKNAAEIKKQKVKFFVRRGGPNYKAGLEYINKEVSKLGIEIEVHGPEMYMTEAINLALK
jgi:ATP-citrate lyase beta-subunit